MLIKKHLVIKRNHKTPLKLDPNVMKSIDLFEHDLDEIPLIEGAIALNVLINPSTDKGWIHATLEQMWQELSTALAAETDLEKKFTQFLDYFYKKWEFQGDKETFFISENTSVESVLKRRKGIPVSLGALLLYFGKKLGFPMEGVMFPSQFVIQMKWPKQSPIYIDPFNGQSIDKSTLKAWLIGYDGPFARLTPKHLKPADNPEILGRWLSVTKGALIREEDFVTALRCSDIALKFMPDDPYEVRDRGFIYQQLDCHKMAAEDFQYFIDNCPEDPSATVLKLQVSALNRHHDILH